MQVVRFGKKEDSNVIDVENVKEDRNDIYCYHWKETLFFLYKQGDTYFWHDLMLNNLKDICFDNFEDALEGANQDNSKIMIFDSQCEVLEYAKKM